MPTYTFKNTQTGEQWDEVMSMSAQETFLSENPHVQTVITNVRIGDPIHLGLRKPDSGFRDVLKNIKDKHYKSTINTW
jgi:hypothetical protein